MAGGVSNMPRGPRSNSEVPSLPSSAWAARDKVDADTSSDDAMWWQQHRGDVGRFAVDLRSGRFTVFSESSGTFIRLGTNDEGEKITTFWPEGGFSILHAIPGIGNKFHHPFQTGPQGEPHAPAGEVRGHVVFDFSGPR